MSTRFKEDLKETERQFIQSYEDSLLKLIGRQDLFQAQEVLPFFALASTSPITKTKEAAENNVKSLFMSVDTKDS
jgi:hypothetical protein